MAIVFDANGNGSFLDDSTKGVNGFPVDLVDPMYKLFLEHLRKDGRSYILEMEDGDNGSMAFVKYEKADGLNSQTISGHHGFDEKGRFLSRNRSISGKSDLKGSEAGNFSGLCVNQAESTIKVDNYEKLLNSEHQGFYGKNFITKCPRKSHSESGESVDLFDFHKSQPASNLVDDTYQEFLSYLKIQDGLMVMEYNSVTIVYEGNESSTAAENLTTEGTYFSDSQGPLPSESTQAPACAILASSQDLVLHGSIHQPDFSVHDADERSVVPHIGFKSFDMKLMAVLNKPYDQYEHDFLWGEANFRKPVLRHKDLRNQCKSFSTAKIGFSYLDHYPDLARELEQADPQQALTLLRGFFFWLENLCHEDAYQPWLSASSKGIEISDYDKVLPTDMEETKVDAGRPIDMIDSWSTDDQLIDNTCAKQISLVGSIFCRTYFLGWINFLPNVLPQLDILLPNSLISLDKLHLTGSNWRCTCCPPSISDRPNANDIYHPLFTSATTASDKIIVLQPRA